ncbi:MAG: hypothetical protein JST51_01545 [Armatimonadetes bacterium]|nr:hypothetical protein [Armatimonadota bacterium]
MATTPPDHTTWDWLRDFGGWLVAAVGFIFSLGAHFQVYMTLGKRVESLETSDDSKNDRLARIETKLDILLGDRKK